MNVAWRVAVFVFMVPACAQSLQPSGSLESLDGLLQANATAELLKALADAPAGPEIATWLRKRAEEGYVVPQYELAQRLSSRNTREALRWFALGRANRVLDERECRDSSRSAAVGLAVDVQYRQLESLTDREELLFTEAIQSVLTPEMAVHGKLPPWWICAPGTAFPNESALLPDPQRRDRRKEQWDFLYSRGFDRGMEARFNANLNPDGYRVWQLPQRYWRGKQNTSTASSGGLSAYWLTEDLVLLDGYFHGSSDTLAFDPIYTWDLSTGEIKLYASARGGLCFFKGFVSYYVQRDSKIYYREGKLGKEEDSAPSPLFNDDYTRFQCRRVSKAESPAPPIWALESGGRLKREDRFKRTPAEYYPAGSAAPVVFDPFVGYSEPGDQIFASSPSYSEYLDAMWMEVRKGSIRSTNAGRVWVLYRDGRVVKRDMPPGPWASGSFRYYPAEGGWLVTSSTKGIYLIRETKTVKLASGNPRSMRVSASGCRAAWVEERPRGEGSPMLVIDLCKAGGSR